MKKDILKTINKKGNILVVVVILVLIIGGIIVFTSRQKSVSFSKNLTQNNSTIISSKFSGCPDIIPDKLLLERYQPGVNQFYIYENYDGYSKYEYQKWLDGTDISNIDINRCYRGYNVGENPNYIYCTATYQKAQSAPDGTILTPIQIKVDFVFDYNSYNATSISPEHYYQGYVGYYNILKASCTKIS